MIPRNCTVEIIESYFRLMLSFGTFELNDDINIVRVIQKVGIS